MRQSAKVAVFFFLVVGLIVTLVFSQSLAELAILSSRAHAFMQSLAKIHIGKPENKTTIHSIATILLSEPSYTVGVYNSSHYYARNVTTGEYEWVDESATAIFSNCIDNLPSGGKIFVKIGTYYCYIELIGKEGITIEGEDRENTVIYMPDGALDRNTLLIRDSDDIVIKNLKVYGNRANNPYQGHYSLQNGIWIRDSTETHVDNVWVDNTPRQGLEVNDAEEITGGHYVEVKNSLFTDCGWNGMTIVVKAVGNEYLVDNCQVTGCSDVGISVYNGPGVTIRNCVAHDNNGTNHPGVNTNTAFAVEANTESPSVGGAVFENCEAYNNYAGYYHLCVRDTEATLCECNFHGNEWGMVFAGAAMGLLKAKNCTIADNIFGGFKAYAPDNVFEIDNCNLPSFRLRNIIKPSKIANSNLSYMNIDACTNLEIYHNNVFEPQVYLSNDPSVAWDNGSLGNYWSDYTGEDSDGDGRGDTPYVIDAENQDNYPLMEPV